MRAALYSNVYRITHLTAGSLSDLHMVISNQVLFYILPKIKGGIIIKNTIEIWAYIENSVGYYVSNLGNVKNSDRKQYNPLTNTYSVFKSKILKQTESFGYKYVGIKFKDGKTRRMRVHILVATYFVKNKNPDKYNIVNHRDGDKSNNVYTNLEWCDTQYNTKHAYINGLINIENFKNINSSQATPYVVIYNNEELLFPTQKSAREYFNVGKTVFKSEKFREEKESEGFIIKKITKEEYKTKKAQRPS